MVNCVRSLTTPSPGENRIIKMGIELIIQLSECVNISIKPINSIVQPGAVSINHLDVSANNYGRLRTSVNYVKWAPC